MALEIGERQIRPTLTEIHISDIHFGAFKPREQYQMLDQQFFKVIENIPFNILSINGDLYDHKCMANSDIAMYATMFIERCCNLCRSKRATLVLIDGTLSHDADQLKLFYHYLEDPSIDIRIVQEPKFEYIQGAKILCIPEKYQLDPFVYNNLLYNNGIYDAVFMHGAYDGAVPQNNVGLSRLFTSEDFIACRGPVISGHVHTPGCFDGFVYYTGSPYRWSFGDEKEKGFLILVHNLETGEYYIHMQPINSYRYITIRYDQVVNDPREAIGYINSTKEQMQIDFIRVIFTAPVEAGSMSVLKNCYHNNPNVHLVFEYDSRLQKAKDNAAKLDELDEYRYILDNKNLGYYEILRRYINQREQQEVFSSADELKREIENDLL